MTQVGRRTPEQRTESTLLIVTVNPPFKGQPPLHRNSFHLPPPSWGSFCPSRDLYHVARKGKQRRGNANHSVSVFAGCGSEVAWNKALSLKSNYSLPTDQSSSPPRLVVITPCSGDSLAGGVWLSSLANHCKVSSGSDSGDSSWLWGFPSHIPFGFSPLCPLTLQYCDIGLTGTRTPSSLGPKSH